MSRPATSHVTSRRRVWPVLSLFVALAIEQLLDLHSTLTAGSTQHEGNKAVNWVAEWLGFAPTIVAAKVAMLSVIAMLYAVWTRSKGSHDREFLVSLGLVAVTYAAVICNNYASRGG